MAILPAWGFVAPTGDCAASGGLGAGSCMPDEVTRSTQKKLGMAAIPHTTDGEDREPTSRDEKGVFDRRHMSMNQVARDKKKEI